VATIAASALLAIAVIGHFDQADWHPVVTVNGATISRADFRDRWKIDAQIQQLGMDRVGSASAGQAPAIEKAFAADPEQLAQSEFIEEALVDAEARRRGLGAQGVDVPTELAAAINAPASRELRWIRLRTVGHSAAEESAIEATVTKGLAAGGDLTALQSQIATSWAPTSGTAWIGAYSPADLNADLDPGAIVAAEDAPVGAVLRPQDNGTYRTILVVGEVAPGKTTGPALLAAVESSGVADGALARWAEARVLRRTLAAARQADARTAGGPQLRMAELVLGSATTGGSPTVELSGVFVRHLDPSAVAAPATLVSELRSMPPQDRVRRFADLVAQANQARNLEPLEHSGEIGWYSADQLVAEVATEAFAPGHAPDDVFGPVQTAAGPEIFLIEAMFSATLDERAAAIATEARDPTADLSSIARRVAPDEAARTDGGSWHALAEFDAVLLRESGVADAPVGALVGPVAINGQIVLGRILERRDGPYTEDELASLDLEGFVVWLRDERAKATVALDPDPLGYGGPSPSLPLPLPTLADATPLATGGALALPPLLPTPAIATPFGP